VSDALPPEDPHGDRAWQAEQRKKRGRRAIFDELEEFSATLESEDAPAEDGEGSPPAADVTGDVKFDRVMISRLFGKVLRLVPISLPENSPVTALGRSGRTYYYLTPKGELVALTDAEHGQAHIAGVWAPETDALNAAFPQIDQSLRFTGFRANYARDAMMAACARKPAFQPHERLRGLGCWLDDEGRLVQHLGDRILVGAEERKPGEIDGYVYPGRPPLPAGDAGEGAIDKCRGVYSRLQSWNWARGELDARLAFGQQATMVLGAALGWRPMAFLCGDASTGKSTLQTWLRDMLPRRLIGTVDASEASLRALLGQDAVGVSFDEIEADASNERAQQVMKLARTAASGDVAYRSGSDQQARQFTLRGSFFFSAIVPPSMRQQDMQRFVFLMLRTLPKDARLAAWTTPQTREAGAAIVGRITGAWPRWPAALEAFQLGLARQGHAQRSQLQFGSLLAAAHLMLEDRAPTPADVDLWCSQLKRETLFEYQSQTPVWLRALRTVLEAQPDVWRGDGSPSVGQVLRKFLRAQVRSEDADRLHDKLTSVGLAVTRERDTGRVFLAVPPRHHGVAQMFRGTDFQAAGGGEGAWHIPLSQAPKVEGAPEDRRGVYRSEKVPRLSREYRCDLFWLDGRAEISGELTPIFDRTLADDQIEAEAQREPGEEG
jgi:hypothetical protein